MRPFFVYMLRCADGTFYTGITTDLTKRLREHNGELKGGAKYTKVRRPTSLLYSEEYNTRSAALIREYEIKQLTRQQKESLTNQHLQHE